MAHHFFGHSHRLDQLVELVASLNAHLVAQIDEVFGRHMTRRTAVARIRAATHATQAGIEVGGTELQCLVVAGDGRAALVVQVHVKALHLGPALADGDHGLSHGMRQVPAHRFIQRHAGHFDANILPLVEHQLEQVHALLE